ncbi:DUF3987 domain-containing protein [Akkermansia sp.]|uniref:DUF3987 domain-containing protein n=1 Tax=Akkermansia sp. TaxID=1872421 RepID=UPI003A954A65
MQQLIPPSEPQQPDISFPTELLPEVLKRTVQNIVDAFRVPENIVGVQVLGLLSGCLGKVYSLQFNGNRVRSNLFLLIVEGSGVGKSRPMDYLRKVITEIETAREYSLATRKSLWKREKKRLDEQYRKLEDSMPCPAPDLQETAIRERDDLLHQIHALERRLACHGDITIEDITPEALVKKLSDSPDQSLLSASSEAREQVKKVIVGYGGNDLSGEKPYLAGFSGDTIKTDRIGRLGDRVNSPCLALVWATQYDSMEQVLGDEGMLQSGFMARCLVSSSFRDLERGQIVTYEPDKNPDPDLNGWNTLIKNILEHRPMMGDQSEAVSFVEVGVDEPEQVLYEIRDLKALCVTYHAEVEHEARIMEIAYRLLLVLAVADQPDQPVVTIEHARCVRELVRHFLSCRSRLTGDVFLDRLRTLLGYIYKKAQKNNWPLNGKAPIRSGKITQSGKVKLDDIKEMARLFPSDLRIEKTDRDNSFLVYLLQKELRDC